MRYLALAALLLVAAADTDVHPKIRLATQRYEAALDKAQAEHDKAVALAKAVYARELDLAMREVTRTGDLDGANAIKAVAEGLGDTRDLAATRLSGKWAITHTDPSWQHGYLFRGDTAQRIDRSGATVGAPVKVSHRGRDVLLNLGDRIERVTVCGDVLFVEHFYPASAYPSRPPAVIGRGVPIK